MTKPPFMKRVLQAMLAIRGVPRADEGPINHPAQLLAALDRGQRSLAGINVTTDLAMRVSAVFACVKVISEDLASLPLNIYQDNGDKGKIRAPEHPAYRLLHDQANYWQTAMEFREMMMNWALLRGRAHALKSRVRGQLDELLPVSPDNSRPVRRPDGWYLEVWPEGGGASILYPAKDVFSIIGVGGGRSVLSDARDTIGLAATQEQFASRGYRDGGISRIALEHPQQLSMDAQNRIRETWVQIYGGEGSARPAILEEGLKANKIGLTAQELQFLEGREFSIEDISRFFRVSPHKIGHLKRATNNNIEELSLDHVTSTLRPWAVRIEQRIKMDLLDEGGTSEYFARHLFDGLLRGDVQKRHAAYAAGRQWGYLCVNDVRRAEDMDPIEGGDEFLVPVNMRNASDPVPQPGATTPDKTQETPNV